MIKTNSTYLKRWVLLLCKKGERGQVALSEKQKAFCGMSNFVANRLVLVYNLFDGKFSSKNFIFKTPYFADNC